MKIRKIIQLRRMSAVVLSMVFLFGGCQADTAGEAETERNETGEETSNQNDFKEENDMKEDISNDETAEENEATEHQEASFAKTDMYDAILAEYSDMVQNDFYMDLQGTDDYESSFGKDIGFEIRALKQDIFYTFYDIDGNGTMELIIAGGERDESGDSFSPWNYDLYGYDGTNAVPIFPDMEFGYRTNFSLYENGVIEVFYSSSAAESGVDFYKIGNDGYTPELVDSFTAEGHLEGEEPVFAYFHNGNEITEEEYNANLQNYEVTLTAALDWVQIQ